MIFLEGIMNTQIQLEKILKDFENYKLAVDAHSIVAITDRRGVITHVNEKFCHISQYSYDELVGSTHKIINSGYHPKSFFQQMWQTISGGKIWKGEICNRAKDGSLYWVETTIVPLKDNEGVLQNYFAVRTDVTQLKNSEDHSRHMALHDELTGLPNRRFMQQHFNDVMVKSNDTGKANALVMLDLDNFKNVNDTLGHACGDDLIKLVAQRLRECIAPPNLIVRLGGDEFLIVLSDLEGSLDAIQQEVMSIANNVQQSLNLPFTLKNQEIYTSSSIGIFIFQDIDLHCTEVLKFADIALHNAKENGKNCICVFNPEMERLILAKTTMLSELRGAIARNELQLYYQQLVNADRQIIGYEALIRWNHPLHGLILPGYFIGEIEKSDLIHEIGNHILRLAATQLKKWENSPLSANWTVSVNISVQQFRRADFDKDVIRIIQETGINPKLLRLELTESMFYEDMQSSIEKMEKLIEYGVRFSMDDFGVGYSSLNYLKLLPLDQLKIDRSFVEHIVTNSRDFAIVKTIIDLAKILNLSVVAEGVETEAQFHLLNENGCHIFQGYYFGRPQAILDDNVAIS